MEVPLTGLSFLSAWFAKGHEPLIAIVSPTEYINTWH